MRCSALFLAAVAAARVRAAPPSASQADAADEGPAYWDLFEDDEFDGFPPTSTSNGFALLSNATGPGCEGTSRLNNEVLGLYLQGYHTGAGTAAAVLHDINLQHRGYVFYLNGTTGGNMSVLTDSGQPQVSYGLVVPDRDGMGHAAFDDEDDKDAIHAPFPDPYHDAVSFRVGPGTPTLMGSLHQGVINLQGTGTFIACNRTVPYSENGWAFTVHYLYANGDGDQVPSRCNNGVTPPGAPPGIPDNCVPITLFALCTNLPPAVVGGYASHAYAHPVECMSLIDDDEYETDEPDWLDESGGEAEAGLETEPEAAGHESEHESEHGESGQATEQIEPSEPSEPSEPEHTEQPEQPDHTGQPDHTEQPAHTGQPDHTEQPEPTEQPEQPEQLSEKPEL